MTVLDKHASRQNRVLASSTFYYDPSSSRAGVLSACSLAHLQQSVFSGVLRRADWWFLVLYHTTLWILLQYYEAATASIPVLGAAADLSFKNIPIVTTIGVFVQVFYVNHAVGRYFAFYSECREMFRAVVRAVLSISVHLSPAELKVASRLLLASVYLTFYEINDPQGISQLEWQELQNSGFLLESELKYLMEHENSTQLKSLIVKDSCSTRGHSALSATARSPVSFLLTVPVSCGIVFKQLELLSESLSEQLVTVQFRQCKR